MSHTSVKLEGKGKAGHLLLLLIDKLVEYIFVQCLFSRVNWPTDDGLIRATALHKFAKMEVVGGRINI